MIDLRYAEERGAAKLDWLDSRHTFSFGHYYNPRRMGFGPLRVINEDRIRPGTGFGTHGHRDMEIITYVLEGALDHKDSLGTGSTIRPGEVQIMSAGTGVRHSEFNNSKTDPVHLLQIWIEPDQERVAPRYDQKAFSIGVGDSRLRLIGSSDGRDGSLMMHQDAAIYAARLKAGQEVAHALRPGRKAWLQVARGTVELNGKPLTDGDGAAIEHEAALTIISHSDDAEILLFDLP